MMKDQSWVLTSDPSESPSNEPSSSYPSIVPSKGPSWVPTSDPSESPRNCFDGIRDGILEE